MDRTVCLGNRLTVERYAAFGLDPARTVLLDSGGHGQTGGSLPLPNPDVTGGIGLSASSGKIALVMTGELLSGTAPSGPQIVDFVGYGSAEFAEGMGGTQAQ